MARGDVSRRSGCGGRPDPPQPKSLLPGLPGACSARTIRTAWIAAALTGLFGVALIAFGLFVTDVAGQAQRSWHGIAHHAAGSVAFLSLPLLTFTWALHAAHRRSCVWAPTSTVARVTMLVLIQGLAIAEYRGLCQRLTIGAGWTWITAFALHLRRATPVWPGAAADRRGPGRRRWHESSWCQAVASRTTSRRCPSPP
ncbi:DUF998 domain-containing protein [Micromonospora cabrerizensis]|uniref:DUF998 domain-containing protein n=1 Tax=Micromonospora cabrerizensis TaxID=2911213 RepID=UPI003557B634